MATNVPYLGRGKHGPTLAAFCEEHHPYAKSDLATCLVERSQHYCEPSGSVALVTPQNWWFLGSYSALRTAILDRLTLTAIVTLGEEAWQSFGDRGPVASLMIATMCPPRMEHEMFAIDALPKRSISEKA